MTSSAKLPSILLIGLLLLSGCGTPQVAPTKASELLAVAGDLPPSRPGALPTSGAPLELEDLPSGWQVTKETINDAKELADDATELKALAEQGFLQNRQREFENRYGGGARRLFISLTRFHSTEGASERVRYVAAVTQERARTIKLEALGADGLTADDAVAMRLDQGNGELAYIAFFRVGSWSVGMMAVSYTDATAFLLASASRQADRLRSLVSAPNDGTGH